MPKKPPFDPNKPFEQPQKPPFDPNQPFSEAEAEEAPFVQAPPTGPTSSGPAPRAAASVSAPGASRSGGPVTLGDWATQQLGGQSPAPQPSLSAGTIGSGAVVADQTPQVAPGGALKWPEGMSIKPLPLQETEQQKSMRQAQEDAEKYMGYFAKLDMGGLDEARKNIEADKSELQKQAVIFEADRNIFEDSMRKLDQLRVEAEASGDPNQIAFFNQEAATLAQEHKRMTDKLGAMQDMQRVLERDSRMADEREYAIKKETGSWPGAVAQSVMRGIGSVAAGVADVQLTLASYAPWMMDKAYEAALYPGEVAAGLVDEEAAEEISETRKKQFQPEDPDKMAKRLKADVLERLRKAPERELTDKLLMLQGIGVLPEGTVATPEYYAEKQQGFVGGSILGLGESLPAMAIPGMVGIAFQTADMIGREMEDERYDDISEGEKLVVKAAVASTALVLERMGFRNLMQNSAVTKRILASAVTKLPVGASSAEIQRILDAETRNWATNFSVSMLGAAAAEFETGAAQQGVEDLIRFTYDQLKGKDLLAGTWSNGKFTPKAFGQVVADMAYAGAQESVGAFVLKAPYAISNAISHGKKVADMDERLYQTMEGIAMDPDFEQAFINQADKDVKAGILSKGEAEKALEDMRTAREILEKIPEDLDGQKRREAFDLLHEKQRLSKKDKNLVGERSKAIDEELKALVGVFDEKPAADKKPVSTERGPKAGTSTTPTKTDGKSEEEDEGGTVQKGVTEEEGGKGQKVAPATRVEVPASGRLAAPSTPNEQVITKDGKTQTTTAVAKVASDGSEVVTFEAVRSDKPGVKNEAASWVYDSVDEFLAEHPEVDEVGVEQARELEELGAKSIRVREHVYDPATGNGRIVVDVATDGGVIQHQYRVTGRSKWSKKPPSGGAVGIVAPYRDQPLKSPEDLAKVSAAKPYREFVKKAKELAVELGTKISSSRSVIGRYTDDDGNLVLEASERFYFDKSATKDQVRKFAAVMADSTPEGQETTIAASYVTEEEVANAVEYTIPVSDVQQAIKAMDGAGFFGYSIEGNNVVVIDFEEGHRWHDAELEQKLDILASHEGLVTGELVENRLDTEVFDARARSSVIQEVRAQGEKRGQGGAALRGIAERAARRNKLFQEQEAVKKERKAFAKLRAEQVELFEKRQQLPPEKLAEMERLHKIIAPSIKGQFAEWQEEYAAALREITIVGNRIASDVGENIPFSLKAIDRATQKTFNWYEGNPNRLGDGARTTIIVNDVSTIPEVIRRIKEEYGEPIREVNKIDERTGYPKVLLEIRTQSGRIAEFQVMRPIDYVAKDGYEGMTEKRAAEARKRVEYIREVTGENIPEGAGHFFYELSRDTAMPFNVVDAAEKAGQLYYSAYRDPQAYKDAGGGFGAAANEMLDAAYAVKDRSKWEAQHLDKPRNRVTIQALRAASTSGVKITEKEAPLTTVVPPLPEQVAEQVAEKMSAAVGTQVVVDKEKFAKALGKDPTSLSKDDERTKGFIGGDGVLYLNPDNVTLDTPLHEIAHLVLEALKHGGERQRAMYDKIIGMVSRAPQDLIDAVAETYSDLSGEKLKEEVFATFVGLYQKNLQRTEKLKAAIENSADFMGRMYEAVKEFLRMIARAFGKPDANLEDANNLMELADVIGERAARGKRIVTPQQRWSDIMRSKELMAPGFKRYTLGVFGTKGFEQIKGKRVKKAAVQQALSQQGVKQIEKDIVNDVLAMPRFQGDMIDVDDLIFHAGLRVTPLQKLSTTSYASYGSERLGKGYGHQMLSTILNMPNIDHGVGGHFPEVFKRGVVEWEIKQVPTTDTWVAIDKNMPGGITAEQMQAYVGTAGLKEDVEKWVEEYRSVISQYPDKPMPTGMFGWYRFWDSMGEETPGPFYVAEIQSDFYQKADDIKRAVLPAAQQEKLKKYEEQVKERVQATLRKAVGDSRRVPALLPSEDYAELGVMSTAFRSNGPALHVPSQKFLFGTPYPKGDRWVLKDPWSSKDWGEYPTKENAELAKAELMEELLYDAPSEYISIFNQKLLDAAPEPLADALNDLQYLKGQSDLPETQIGWEGKQMLAMVKTWEKRLLREAIKQAAERGATEFRLPTPNTVARIEGYAAARQPKKGGLAVAEGDLPYTFDEDDLNDDGTLNVGAKIEMDGDTYIVLEVNGDQMEVAKDDQVHLYTRDQAVRDHMEGRGSDIDYELRRHFLGANYRLGYHEMRNTKVTRKDLEEYEGDHDHHVKEILHDMEPEPEREVVPEALTTSDDDTSVVFDTSMVSASRLGEMQNQIGAGGDEQYVREWVKENGDKNWRVVKVKEGDPTLFGEGQWMAVYKSQTDNDINSIKKAILFIGAEGEADSFVRKADREWEEQLEEWREDNSMSLEELSEKIYELEEKSVEDETGEYFFGGYDYWNNPNDDDSWYVMYDGHTETLSTPGAYEEAAKQRAIDEAAEVGKELPAAPAIDPGDVDLSKFSGAQIPVLSRYIALQDIFKKERGGNVQLVEDPNGYSWLSTPITQEDKEKPIIGFSRKLRPLKVGDKEQAKAMLSGDATPVQRMFAKQEARMERTRRFSLSKIREWYVKAAEDPSGIVKQMLRDVGGFKAVRERIRMGGASASAKLKWKDFHKRIYKDLSPEEEQLLNRVLQAKRTIAVDAKRDLEGRERIESPDGLHKEDHEAELDRMRKANPSLMRKIEKRADAYFDANRELLKMKLDEGRISSELYDSLVGWDYARRAFLHHIEDAEGAGNRSVFGSRASRQDIKALDEGSEEGLFNDFRYLLKAHTLSTYKTNFENRANKAIAEMIAENPDNGIFSMVKAIGFNEKTHQPIYPDPRAGMDHIVFFSDGRKQVIEAPAEVVKEWNEQEPIIRQNAANIIRMISLGSFKRMMLTGVNPAFILTNTPRDILHVLMNTNTYSPILPVALAQISKDIAAVSKDALMRGPLYQQYIEGGGGMDFLTTQGRPLDAAGKIEDSSYDKAMHVLGYLNETSELLVRLAMFKRDMDRRTKTFQSENGREPDQQEKDDIVGAAIAYTRDQMDFNQGGLVAKAVDNFLPYTNAVFQGTRVYMRYARTNPKLWAYKTMQLGAVAGALVLYNLLSYPDDWDDIPEEVKSRYFIFLLPITVKDKDGRTRRKFLSIPKSQDQSVMAGFFEAMVELGQRGKYPGTRWMHDFETTLPTIDPRDVPLIDMINSYYSGFDTYTGRRVYEGQGQVEAWREYVSGKTPQFYIDMGQATAHRDEEGNLVGGISPERARLAAKKVAGSASGNIYATIIDKSYGAITEAIGANEREELDKTMLEHINDIVKPFRSRILKETMPTSRMEELEKFSRLKETTRVDQNDEVRKMLQKYKKAEGPQQKSVTEEFKAWLREQPRQDRERLRDRYKEGIKNKDVDFWYIILKTEPSPEARAMSVYNEWRGMSDQKRDEMWDTINKVGGIRSDRFQREFGRLKATYGDGRQ